MRISLELNYKLELLEEEMQKAKGLNEYLFVSSIRMRWAATLSLAHTTDTVRSTVDKWNIHFLLFKHKIGIKKRTYTPWSSSLCAPTGQMRALRHTMAPARDRERCVSAPREEKTYTCMCVTMEISNRLETLQKMVSISSWSFFRTTAVGGFPIQLTSSSRLDTAIALHSIKGSIHVTHITRSSFMLGDVHYREAKSVLLCLLIYAGLGSCDAYGIFIWYGVCIIKS